MGFKEGMCPKCHELLQVPEDRERILWDAEAAAKRLYGA